MYNLVSRNLGYFSFCVHDYTVSQRIPSNRKEMSIAAALRTQQRFNNEDVDVVIAYDETFILFYESSSTVVSPKGPKRVGSDFKYNDK